MAKTDDNIAKPSTYKVGVMGAGAMGCLFGALLHKAGAEVWLIDGWKEHMDIIKSQGLLIREGKKEEWVSLNATTDPEEPGVMDLVILLSKTNALSDSVKAAGPMIGDKTFVLGLQNGLGNAEKINEFIPENQILFGLCEVGSDLLGPGEIEPHMANGIIKFKPLSGEVTDQHQQIVELFNKGGIEARIAMDIEQAIWEKLCLNACFNATCALTRLKAGAFAAHKFSYDLVDNILKEIIAVAAAKRIVLNYDGLSTSLKKASEMGGDHYPSLAQDVMHKRPTEIESLNGGIVAEGLKHNVPTPVNATIASLITIIEDTYEQQF